MKSLLEVLREELKKYNNEDILDVIDNREQSARYIKKLINEDMDLPCENMTIKSLKSNFGDRINHILFTFSMGLLLAKFKNLDKLIENEYTKYFDGENNVFFKTWLIISLYHDYGYFLFTNDKYKDIKHLDDFNVKHSIFNYISEENEAKKLFGLNYLKPEKSRYSKKLYSSYFDWRMHESSGYETFEHGISGGYVLFDDIVNNNLNSSIQEKKKLKKIMMVNENNVSTNMFYQNICFRIMEHNIWTINPKGKFESSFDISNLSEIYIGNYSKITIDEPLLYLLSLVDTIEFIKRMSTTSLDNQNSQSRPSTLSRKILIDVEYNHIFIDTSLTNTVSGCDKWREGILNLKDWVNVSSEMLNGLIKIK